MTCGGGKRSRERKVVREPTAGGAACENREEQETCNTDPCQTTTTTTTGNTQTTTTTTVQIQGQQSPTPLLSPDLNSETQVTPRQAQQTVRWIQIQILGQQPPRLLLGLHWQLSQESWLSSDDYLRLPPTMNNEELREAGFCEQFVKNNKRTKNAFILTL